MFNKEGQIYIYPEEILDRHRNSGHLWRVYNSSMNKFELMSYLLERLDIATRSRGYYMYCLFSAFVCFIYLFIQKRGIDNKIGTKNVY